MSDRSIGEIIGWDSNPSPRGVYWTKPGTNSGAPPRVDDLLAWLYSNHLIEDFGRGWSDGNRIIDEYTVEAYLPGPCDDPEDYDFRLFTAPTLIAALEAAVRAVDSRSHVGCVVDDGTTTDGGTL